VFSFNVNDLRALKIDIERKKFPPTKIHIVAETQKINENEFIINLNDFKIRKISHISDDIRKYIISVIIGHELIHIIQFHLK